MPITNPCYRGVYVVAINPDETLWGHISHLLALALRWARSKHPIGRPTFHVAVKGDDEVDASLIERLDMRIPIQPELPWRGTRPLVPPPARQWIDAMLYKHTNIMYVICVSEYP